MILAANAAVGVITETNAEKALEELRAYQADVATVLRNGCFSILPATELVPGDIVEVGVGCKVPADMRMIEMLSNQLRVDQAILTGESCSVAKDLESTSATNVVYQDKTNILFSVINFSTGRVIDKVYLENEVTAMDNDHTGQLIFSGDAHGCIYNTVSVNSHAGSISTLHKNRSVRNRSVVTIMQYHTFSLVARSPVLLVCAQDGSLCFFRELLWRYVVI